MKNEIDIEDLRFQWASTIKGDHWEHADPSLTYRRPLEDNEVGILNLPTLALHHGAVGRADSGHTTIPVSHPDSNVDIVSSPAQYEFLEVLGRGGMGVVYRARQLSLDREVAIKKIRPEKLRPDLLMAFHMEARVTGQLDHPHIVPIYDLGLDADGAAILVMKVVEGESWKEILRPVTDKQKKRSAGYSLEKHLQVLISVCHGLAFAHSRGIVHCDLKPENIMVGQFGEVLIMDWGVAIDVRDLSFFADQAIPANHRTRLTAPQGTPVYMPPELVRGSGFEIDEQTDVYLLGAILYELLEGQPPHVGKTLTQVLMKAQRSRTPNFQPGVPEELQQIGRRAMSRFKGDRFVNVTEFQQRLLDYLGHRQSAFISSTAQLLLDRCRERSEGSGVHGAQGVNELYTDFTEAVAGFKQARLLWAENLQAIEGELAARLDFARLAIRGGDLKLAQAQVSLLNEGDSAVQLLQRDIEGLELKRRQAESSVQCMALLQRAQECVFRRRNQEEIVALIERGLKIAERSEAALLAAAKVYEDSGQIEETKALLMECAQTHSPGYEALFYLHRLDIAGDPASGFRFTFALQRLIAEAEGRHEDNEFTLLSKAIRAMEEGDYDGALGFYNLIEESHTTCFPWAYNGRAYIYFVQGRIDEALADYGRALELEPSFVGARSNRSYARFCCGDFEGAIEDCNRAIEIDGDNAELLNNRGGAFLSLGREQAAMADFDKSIEINSGHSPAYFNRGFLKLCQSQNKAAIEDMMKAARLNSSSPVALIWLIALGQTVYLEEISKKWDDWSLFMAQSLQSQAALGDVLAMAETAETPQARTQRCCEAYGYLGLAAEQREEWSQAEQCYKNCVATGVTHFVEYIWALKRLDYLEDRKD
jgi:serine/threonine protein kinase/tetratricopeptide (TPR) repeat protein